MKLTKHTKQQLYNNVELYIQYNNNWGSEI